MLVALPTEHPLAKKARVRLADLASQFFIGMSAQTHPGAREWLAETCRAAGFAGRILQEADSETTVIQFVADGLGVALLPEQITGLPHEGVVFRPSCGNRPSPGTRIIPQNRSRITFRS